MAIFDTHAHYTDERFDADRNELLSALPSFGVECVICPGTDAKDSAESFALSSRYPYIYSAAGIHPHEAEKACERDFELLGQLLKERKTVAVGEIGLDYHYDLSPREKQNEVFRRCLSMADEAKLPAIIHDRDAHADCLAAVREFPDVTGVFHCYSGSAESAKVLADMGWYFGFTGMITLKNAKKFDEIVRCIPSDRIVIETDCPYLSPEPVRGMRCDSRLLFPVAKKLSQMLGISVWDTFELTARNAKRLFNL